MVETVVNYIISRDFIRLRLLSRWFGLLLILPGQILATGYIHTYQVYLQSLDQSISLNIAQMHMQPHNGGMKYRLSMNENQFADYFLNMRPFRCMTDQVNMLCHLAYPYEIQRHITDNDLSAMEHDLLFIRRKPTDYGIDPWNGLVFRINKKGDEYTGIAHEVDLNILAVPPEVDDSLPLKNAEIHEIDAEQLWLPRLLIQPE